MIDDAGATDGVRDAETKRSFVAYLAAHPEQRFWQAVRNWSGFAELYGTERLTPYGSRVTDTFNLEGPQARAALGDTEVVE